MEGGQTYYYVIFYTKKLLYRILHPPTGGDDVEWLEEDEVPIEVSDQVPSTIEWTTWPTNPFCPDD